MIKQILSFGIVETISKGLNFLVLLLLPLVLPVKEFGVVGIIVSIEALISSMLLFGQDRVILRYYSFEKDKNKFLFSVVAIWVIVSVVVSLFGLFVIIIFFRNGIYGIKFWPDTFFLTIIVLLTSFRLIFISVVRIQNNVKHFSIDKLVFQILKIIIVFLFAFELKTATSYIYGVSIALLVVFFMEILYLKDFLNFQLDKSIIKRNWNFGFPFVVHVMAGNLLLYFSRFVLEKYASMETVALYTFASNLGVGISFVYAAFIVYFEPQIYKYSNDEKKSENWLAFFSLSTLAITSIFIIGIILIAPVVIENYFNKEYLKAIPIISIILAAISMNAIYLQSSYRLTIYERTKLIPIATVIAGIVNIISNLILVPKFGLYGAAVATFISYFVLSITTFVFSVKYTTVKLQIISGKIFFVGTIIIAFLSMFDKLLFTYLTGLIVFVVIIGHSIYVNYFLKLKTEK